MSKTFLLTGVSGYLGGALARELLAKGHRVIGISRQKSISLKFPNFELVACDIRERFVDKLADKKIDGVFHLAAQKPAKDMSYEDYFIGNVNATFNVIQLVKSATIPFLVYVSTGSVFGKTPAEKNLHEKLTPVPVDYYGLTKYVAELLLEIELNRGPAKAIVVRCPTVFGGVEKESLVAQFCQLAQKDADIELYSKGERYRNFLYIDSLVDALIKVSERAKDLNNFEVFMLGSAESITGQDLAAMIKEALHSNSKIIPVDKFPRYDWDVFIDVTKAKKLLNWKPSSMKETIHVYLKGPTCKV
jgi:nucleoside-diphosphate-sugar epimerase